MCCGALRRSTGCFNQQSILTVSQPKVSHNPQGISTKVNVIQSTVNAEQQQHKVNTARSKVNVQPRFLCQKMRIAEIGILGEFGVKWTKRWPKSMLVKDALETLDQIRNRKTLAVVFPHVREKKLPKWWSNQSDTREKCVMSDGENDFQRWPIYIHLWGCVTHQLGLQAYITIMADLAHKWN